MTQQTRPFGDIVILVMIAMFVFDLMTRWLPGHLAGLAQESPKLPAISRRPPGVLLTRTDGEVYIVVHRVTGGDTMSQVISSHRGKDYNSTMVEEAERLTNRPPLHARPAYPGICNGDLVPIAVFDDSQIKKAADLVHFSFPCDEVYAVNLKETVIDWASRKKAQIVGINMLSSTLISPCPFCSDKGVFLSKESLDLTYLYLYNIATVRWPSG